MKTLIYILIMLLGGNWICSLVELMPGKGALSPCITSMLSSREAFEEKTLSPTQNAGEKNQDISRDCNSGKCRFGNCSHGFPRTTSHVIESAILSSELDATPYLFVVQCGIFFFLIRPPILA